LSISQRFAAESEGARRRGVRGRHGGGWSGFDFEGFELEAAFQQRLNLGGAGEEIMLHDF
jgi:hypothetical protein